MHARWMVAVALIALATLCSVVAAQPGSGTPVLHAVIVRPNGTPAAGAQVWVMQAATIGSKAQEPVFADYRGRFETPASWQLGPTRPPGVENDPSAVVMAALPDEGLAGIAPAWDASEIRVELSTGAWVETRAIDPDGNPVEDADLRLSFLGFDRKFTMIWPERSLADGHIRVGPLPADCWIAITPGFYSRQILCTPWVGPYQRPVGRAGEDAQLSPLIPGQVTTLPPLVLAPHGASLSGTVVDADGNPVAGARVLCDGGLESGQQGQPLGWLREVSSTEDGGFRFEGTRTNGTFGVLAVSEDGQLACGLTVDPTAGIETELGLKPLVTLSGRVIDAVGKPAPGAAVRIMTSEFGRGAVAHGNPYICMVETAASDEGLWEAQGLFAGFCYSISANESSRLWGRKKIVVEDDTADIEVVLGQHE